MRNEEISQRTKTQLAACLKNKMAVKSLSKITVSELIQDCNVNRNTFYYHFDDLYSLLKWTLEQEAITVVQETNLLENAEGAICFILDYVTKNRNILSSAYDSLGYDELKRFFYADIYAIIDNAIGLAEHQANGLLPKERQGFYAMFYTEAVAGSLINYLKDPTRWTQGEVEENLLLLIKGVTLQITEELK